MGEEQKNSTIGVPTQTINASTGEVISEKMTVFHLMPADPGKCPFCNYEHSRELPHNRDSIFYQYSFYATHGRWPTWTDAMAHCTPFIQECWKLTLKEVGAWDGPPDAPEKPQEPGAE